MPTDCLLVLNAAIVTVDPESIVVVGCVPFEDEEQLGRIRRELRGTHLVLRSGESVRIVALTDDAKHMGDPIRPVQLTDDPALHCALIRERLIAMFTDARVAARPSEIMSHRPVELISGLDEDDLVPKVIRQQDRARIPSWLSRRVRYEFDARYFEQVGTKPVVLLSLGTRTVNRIDATCRELVAAGVPITGRYVEVSHDGDDPRLGPRRMLVGRVDAIEDGLIRLGDARDGWAEVLLDDAFLEPRDENLEACLVAVVGREANNTAEALRNASGYVTNGPSRLRRGERLARFIEDRGLGLAPGVVAKAGDLLHSDLPQFPEWEVMDDPTLIFSPDGRAGTLSHDGLDRHGPYDHAVFSKKSPRIALICQSHRQGDTERFVEALLGGVKGKVFGKGMLRRFMLKRPHVEFFCTKDRSADAYEVACRAAFERAADADFTWDLALIQIEDEFKGLPAARNPYLVTKAIMHRHQVPAQEFTLRTMGLKDFAQSMALNNISLACYAKLGGTPWVLQADPTVAHELVIGLRSYKPLDSRFDSRSRYVGLTTVFKGDGRYLLEGRTRAVRFEDYAKELLDTLRKAVAAVREDQNWDGREHIRFIFHAFKPLKHAEIDAVRELMDELGLPNAQFAFLQMVEDHPYAVMDKYQPGLEVRASRGRKGINAPPRGLFLPLGSHDALVAFKGAEAVKRENHGLPRPILMRLHKKSTFDDLTYLARQALSFSAHSWRTFGKDSMPITVSYSGLIAEMLGQLQEVPGWSDDSMLGTISRTRWFL